MMCNKEIERDDASLISDYEMNKEDNSSMREICLKRNDNDGNEIESKEIVIDLPSEMVDDCIHRDPQTKGDIVLYTNRKKHQKRIKSKSSLSISATIIRESIREYEEGITDEKKNKHNGNNNNDLHNKTAKSSSPLEKKCISNQCKTQTKNDKPIRKNNSMDKSSLTTRVTKTGTAKAVKHYSQNKTNIKGKQTTSSHIIKTKSIEKQIDNREASINKLKDKDKKNKVVNKVNQTKIDNLYQSKKLNQHKLLQLQMEIMEKENKEYEQECTFKPKINKEKRLVDEIYGNNCDFSLRQKIWLDKAKEKLDKEKVAVYKNEKIKCTFHPQIANDVPEYGLHDVKGTKGYYERKSRMNKINEEINNKRNPDYVQKYNNIYNKKKDGRVCNENLTLTEFKSALKSLHTELLNDDDD